MLKWTPELITEGEEETAHPTEKVNAGGEKAHPAAKPRNGSGTDSNVAL